MIFVSYCHADDAWKKRFEIISKPLSDLEHIEFWSDKKLKAGEWKPQLEAAMKGAIACVLLVSDNFLASNFVRTIELPYLLEAYEKRVLMVFWAYLEPCDIKRFPSITRFQAMTLSDLKSMAQMNQWEWKQTMLKGCDMIDEFLKDLEAPIINQKIIGKRFPRVSNIQILAKTSRRRVEILVYSHYSQDKKWWKQAPVEAGKVESKIHLGNETTMKNTRFKIVAMTTEQPLTKQTFLSLPEHRRMAEFELLRD
jgi:hypothetical protein